MHIGKAVQILWDLDEERRWKLADQGYTREHWYLTYYYTDYMWTHSFNSTPLDWKRF